MGGMVDGLFAGPYVDEFDEGGLDELVEDTDNAARAEADRLARTPQIREWSPAGLVKRAVELRSAGQPFAKVFDMEDPVQKRLFLFVEALDETGLRAITQMPVHTLARHLEETNFRASGLRPVGQQIMLAREEREADKVEASDPQVKRKRSRAASILAETAATGRPLDLGEAVALRRRAA